MPKSVGIIHARGGSRRIPRKNIKLLLGSPLIAYVVRAAVTSRLDRVIVSTDDDEIAATAERHGAVAPFRRPAHLAEDVPSEQVTLHALEWLAVQERQRYEVAVTLQPTTPFVRPEDINACLDAVVEPGAAAAITVKRATQPPHWMFAMESTGLGRPLLDGVVNGERGVIQSLPSLYLPNGAVYATRTTALKDQNAILASPLRLVPMPAERSVDLDEPIDWVIAEAVGRHYGFALSVESAK